METKESNGKSPKKNYLFKKNELDPLHNRIKQVYHTKRESEVKIKYVIYKTENGSLIIGINPNDIEEYREYESKCEKNIILLEPELSLIRARLPVIKLDLIYKVVSKSIDICLQYGEEKEKSKLALNVLSEAKTLIEYYTQIFGKIQYLSGGAIILILSLLLFIWTKNNSLTELEIFSEVILYGAIGSYLSVGINSKKLFFEPGSPFNTNLLAGSLRIIIGVLSGVVILITIESKILFGLLSSLNESNDLDIHIWFVRLLAVISGFSETFVPDIIERVTNKEKKEPNSKVE